MSNKYYQTFKVSWEAGFVYRLNFIMWRLRVVIGMLTTFLFWRAVMGETQAFGGYTESAMLTYVLGTSFIRSVVFSSRSIDAQGEIASGDLNNYLVKPVNYFTYWFSRDLADKILNVLFSITEIALILFLFKPPVSLPPDLISGLLFLFILTISAMLYFWFSFLISQSTFWMPEGNGWPQRFLIFTLLSFFAGGLFPLDSLPSPLSNILIILPTAYFQFIPMQFYLGRFNANETVLHIALIFIRTYAFMRLNHLIFRKGRKIYGAYGR